MKNSINLCGKWLLSLKKPLIKKMPVNIPGDIHSYLIKSGIIKEPLYDMNVLKSRWVENKEWFFEKEFDVPRGFEGDRLELVFEGLDTTSEIFINGKLAGRTNNALVPHVFNVIKFVKAGENTLVVKLDDGVLGVLDKELGKYGVLKKHNGQRIWVRKPQFTFGWDWAPRMLTCGIWRPVKLVSYDKIAIRNCFIKTRLAGKYAFITQEIEIESFVEGTLGLSLDVSMGGKTEKIKIKATKGINRYTVLRKIRNPKLWWPNGMGEPALHDFKIEVKNNSQTLDVYKTVFGIREVELIREDLPPPEGGRSFTIAVNGEKVFARGANWVPADGIPARITKEKYRKLVDYARDANFNMFRVWGGGIYEDEEFYRACNENGIMIWQDFIFACAMYPDDDPAFREAIKEEAEKAVKRLRNNPCIVLWCGNNENNEAYDERWIGNSKDKKRVFYGKRVYHEILPSACSEFDGTRPYWPGSPYGGKYANSDYDGDMHAWNVGLHGGPKGRVDYRNFAKVRGKFISEYGLVSMPSYSSVKKYLPEPKIDFDSKSFKFHVNRMNHFGTRDKNEPGLMEKQIDLFYGDHKKLSMKDFISVSQLIQGEGYKYEIEHLRRRKFFCSGSLFWMYSDAWGELGWTIVDYYLNRKLSYYLVKKAYQPLLVSIKEEEYGVSIWVVNDTLKGYNAELEYGIVNFTGEKGYLSFGTQVEKINRKKIFIKPNFSGKAAIDSLDVFKRDNVYYAKLKINGKIVNENYCLAHPLTNIRMPAAKVKYSISGSKISFRTDCFAYHIVMELPEGVNAEENVINILPGGSKTVKLSGDKRKFKKIKVKWYNKL